MISCIAVAEAQSAPPPTAKRIDFEVQLTPARLTPGQVATLKVTAKPRAGFYTYPATQRTADQTEGMLTQLDVKFDSGVELLFPVRESPAPAVHDEGDVGKYLVYEQPVTWEQDLLVKPDAPTGRLNGKLKVRIQVCDKSCVVGTHEFDLSLEVEPGVADITPEIAARRGQIRPEARVVDVGGTAVTPAERGPGANRRGLGAAIITASLAAIAMLFTPCVFPMIPITVSVFLKQSQTDHRSALLKAAVYSVTIIVTLTFAVMVLGQLIVQWANSSWLNLALGVVLCYFAFSLLGMYEIELPAFLIRFTSRQEGRGGYLGIVFTALTFTVTSFTCTGPFLGPFLVATKEVSLRTHELLLVSLAYSATFAAPFFVLALFPGLIRALPRSGGWLNAVKVVMGFLELGAALKFLANADLTLHPGNPWLFTYDSVLCAWIALSVACGIYLLGGFRMPHDEPFEHLSVPRMILATIFIGMSVYLAPALWRVKPLGIVGESLVAFLPLDTRHADEWTLDYQAAWEEAVRTRKPLFIDFTGVNCTNCRYNELNVFTKPEVIRELQHFVKVKLYTDSVPLEGLSRADAEAAGLRNAQLQAETFADASQPLYVVLRPEPGESIRDGKFTGKEVDRRKGLIPASMVGDFVDMLRRASK